jgi:FAD/FMN-containing dehydrogenase
LFGAYHLVAVEQAEWIKSHFQLGMQIGVLVEMEGTVTGEHGVGLVKRDYLEHELGETTVDTMRRVSLDTSHGR